MTENDEGTNVGSRSPAESREPTPEDFIEMKEIIASSVEQIRATSAAQTEAVLQSESFRLGHFLIRTLKGDQIRQFFIRLGRSLARWIPVRLRHTLSRSRLLERTMAADEGRSTRSRLPPGPLPVPMGDHISVESGAASQIPVVMFLMLDLRDADPAVLVDRIASRQVVAPTFRPLFVTDAGEFAAFREYGYLFERIVPKTEWEAVTPVKPWRAYVFERLAELMRLYAPALAIALDGTDVDEKLDGIARLDLMLATLDGVRSAPILPPKSYSPQDRGTSHLPGAVEASRVLPEQPFDR